jgi:hypothetical protein
MPIFVGEQDEPITYTFDQRNFIQGEEWGVSIWQKDQ